MANFDKLNVTGALSAEVPAATHQGSYLRLLETLYMCGAEQASLRIACGMRV